jgi:high-affinity iron transporter
MQPAASRKSFAWTRIAWWTAAAVTVAGLVYLMATATTGPIDPTEVRGQQSHTTVVFNSAIIVFREGLEAILIFAAVTASMVGANKHLRRPVSLGAAAAFGAAVATWFLVQALLGAFSSLGMRLEAITGFIAIIVLLIVLNWFVHKVYWSEWIGRHHRQRKRVLARVGISATLGLVLLGFTSVFREGFEVVLFLQTLQLQAGSATVLEGVALGLAGTAAVGMLTFWLHHKLPYKKMLVLTGCMLGVVLVVMIGGTAATFQDLGWLPQHDLPFAVPQWLGAWFEIYGTYETIAVQITAALFVVGSYVLAKHMLVRRPMQRGEQPATRAESVPTEFSPRAPAVGPLA